MAVIVKDKGLKNIIAEMRKADRLQVGVGVHQGDTSDGVAIAEYATYNEYGTSTVPSRPFMATTFDESKQLINKDLAAAAKQVTSGKMTADQALMIVGEKHSQRIKTTITRRDFLPALKPSTVAAKKGSTKTLVDTGALVNSIHPVVRTKQ